MKTKQLLVALLAVFALLAAACGSDTSTTAEGDGDTTTETDADTTEDDAMEDGEDDGEAMEEEEPEETPEPEPAPEGQVAGAGGNLLLLQWQAPSQANSHLSSGFKDLLAGSLALEPLAWITPTGELTPALAAEIPSKANGGIAEDNSSVTWTLLEGVTWSDGTPFTADDVLFTFEYCSDEATGCSGNWISNIDSVVVDSDTQVTVNFIEPAPYPFEPFVGQASTILQRAQFADCVGEAAKACSDQNFAPVGTGPFVITELRPEDTLTAVFNENYRGAAEGKPFFGSVEIKGGGDAEAAARSVLEVGEADYAWNLQVAPEILGPMESAGIGRLQSAFAANVEHINLNQTDPNGTPPSEGAANPLFVDNPDLHRALSIAINRDELNAVGYGPAGKPTCNLWPVGAQASTNNDWCLTQNTAEANELLDGLGYLDTDGDGVREADGVPLEFDFVTSTNGVRQSNQELVRAHWAEIGVQANMLNEDASLFFDGTCASDVCIWKFFTDIQMFTNGASAPYAGTYLNGYTSDKFPTAASSWGGDNIPRLNNADYDALELELRSVSLDDPRFTEIVVEMNDIVSNTAVIPLIHRASASAFSNTIDGTGELNGWDSEYYNIEDWFRTEG